MTCPHETARDGNWVTCAARGCDVHIGVCRLCDGAPGPVVGSDGSQTADRVQCMPWRLDRERICRRCPHLAGRRCERMTGCLGCKLNDSFANCPEGHWSAVQIYCGARRRESRPESAGHRWVCGARRGAEVTRADCYVCVMRRRMEVGAYPAGPSPDSDDRSVT